MLKDVATYKLEDLTVKEVSMVDSPANKRAFLLVKSEDAPDVFADPVVAAQAERAKADTDLTVALPVEMRDELAAMFDGIATRCKALGEAVKASSPGEGTVSDKFKNEVLDLSAVLRAVASIDQAKALPTMRKTDPVPVLSMKSVEYVMTANGPAMLLPPEEMARVAADYSRDKIMSAEWHIYVGDLDLAMGEIFDAVKALSPFLVTGTPVSDSASALLNAVNKAASTPDAPQPVGAEKAGRKIAGERLGKLEGLLAQLAQVVSELRPADAAEAEVAKLKATVAKQAAEINRPLRPLGNASHHDEPAKVVPVKVTWPDDLTTLEDDSDLV